MATEPPLRYARVFRPHQEVAIAMARRYRSGVREAQVAGAAGPPGAALVCHPTGTGKTAVIAALAQCAPEIGNVLVLSTREAIRDQLVRELSGNIFISESKFGLASNIKLPKVCYVVARGQDLQNPEMLRQATIRRLSGRRYGPQSAARRRSNGATACLHWGIASHDRMPEHVCRHPRQATVRNRSTMVMQQLPRDVDR